jgi:hypothetical protein
MRLRLFFFGRQPPMRRKLIDKVRPRLESHCRCREGGLLPPSPANAGEAINALMAMSLLRRAFAECRATSRRENGRARESRSASCRDRLGCGELILRIVDPNRGQTSCARTMHD